MIDSFKDGKIQTTIKKATKDTFKVARYDIIVYDKWDTKKEYFNDFKHFIEWLYWKDEKIDIMWNEKSDHVSVIFTNTPYYER